MTGTNKTYKGPGLTSRSQRVLDVVVREYIGSVRPVSSALVARSCGLNLGAASIRAILSELEQNGYLVKDHSSSGRIPTDKSFRLYVDTLRELTEPKPSDIASLSLCESGPLPVKTITLKTTRALSTLTNCAALLLMPGVKNFTIKEIRLLAINNSRVLVIIVSNSGLVHTSTVNLESQSGALNMERASNYLCSIGQGLTLRGLRRRLFTELAKERKIAESHQRRTDAVAREALRVGSVAAGELEQKVEEDIFLEGTALIFEQPEFKEDAARIKNVFAALEEKSLIVKILDASINDIRNNGINVHMGSEGASRVFDGLSFVTAPYGTGQDVTGQDVTGQDATGQDATGRDATGRGSTGRDAIGMIGIVGPVRMDYQKIIPLVNYAAAQLGRTTRLQSLVI